MRHHETRAALDHYDDLVVPDRSGELRAVPTDDKTLVHVVLRPRRRFDVSDVRWEHLSTNLPVFLDSWREVRAACGRRAKVILPVEFNDVDPDACPRCVRNVRAWAHAPSAWWQEADERDRKRMDRLRQEADVAAWQAAERARQDAQRRLALARRSDLRTTAEGWPISRPTPDAG